MRILFGLLSFCICTCFAGSLMYERDLAAMDDTGFNKTISRYAPMLPIDSSFESQQNFNAKRVESLAEFEQVEQTQHKAQYFFEEQLRQLPRIHDFETKQRLRRAYIVQLLYGAEYGHPESFRALSFVLENGFGEIGQNKAYAQWYSDQLDQLYSSWEQTESQYSSSGSSSDSSEAEADLLHDESYQKRGILSLFTGIFASKKTKTE